MQSRRLISLCNLRSLVLVPCLVAAALGIALPEQAEATPRRVQRNIAGLTLSPTQASYRAQPVICAKIPGRALEVAGTLRVRRGKLVFLSLPSPQASRPAEARRLRLLKRECRRRSSQPPVPVPTATPPGSGDGAPGSRTNCELADLTHDGKVDLQDVSIFFPLYTSRLAQADLNGDTSVDVSDLSLMLSCYGQSGQGGGGENQAPQANSQSISTTPGSSIPIVLSGHDPEEADLHFEVLQAPAHGTLSGNSPHLAYSPAPDFRGQDRFTFRAFDGSLYSDPATVEITVTDYVAPIGIPLPSFGITQSHLMYHGQQYQFSSGTQVYPEAQNGPFTHYVDNTASNATDDGNPYGTPGRPRRTLPSNLTPGSVVEVHGGPYAYGSGYIEVNGNGTVDRPVFIRGIGAPRFNQKISVYQGGNALKSYILFEGLNLYKWEVVGPANHIALRHSEVHHGGATSVEGRTGFRSEDIVFYHNAIHDNGNWQADFDEDVHGTTIGGHSSNIWILDSEYYHNSGDGVQINAGGLETQASLHHVYVGGNISHHNKQSGLWTKQAVDVIFSQNLVYAHEPVGASPSAWGGGMGFQYGPERVWFLYNHIYNCRFGISTASTSGLGFGTDSYFVGNLIHDIHHDPDFGYNPGTAWSNAGMSLVGTTNKYLINNTLFNVDAGFNIVGGGHIVINNNIVAQVTEPGAQHLFVEDTNSLQNPSIERNLFFQSGGAARLKWVNTILGLSDFRSLTGTCASCSEGDPLFVSPSMLFGNPSTYPPEAPPAENMPNLRLTTGSPAIDSASADEVYARFEALYGRSILVDHDRIPRPQGAQLDRGAFEFISQN